MNNKSGSSYAKNDEFAVTHTKFHYFWIAFIIIILSITNFNFLKDKERIPRVENNLVVAVDVKENSKSYSQLSNELGWLWGTDGEQPKNFINSVEIYKGKELIYTMPKEFFNDLFSIHRPSIKISKLKEEDYLVSMRGGDAAGGFDVDFVIIDNELAYRVIKDCVIPDEPIRQDAKFLLQKEKRKHPYFE